MNNNGRSTKLLKVALKVVVAILIYILWQLNCKTQKKWCSKKILDLMKHLMLSVK